MKRVYIWLFSALLVWGVLAQASATRLEGEARLARQTTAQALKDATLAASAAASALHTSSRMRLERDSALAKANLLAARSARVRTVYKTVLVPDTCKTVVALADSALVAADGVTVELRAALSASQNGERALQTAVDTLLPALQHLRSASSTLLRTSNSASKRSLIARLLPHPGVGLAVGVDALGAPHLITGITLGWNF